MLLKLSSATWRPFCLGLHVLNLQVPISYIRDPNIVIPVLADTGAHIGARPLACIVLSEELGMPTSMFHWFSVTRDDISY